jgi:ATP-binding cassette subfamily A (ABC1) protein 1/ATP-binding cassette subfamily A (ABC1) protein 3
VDAVITLDSLDSDTPHYTLRGNHTDLPSTRLLYNEFDLLPDPQYKLYWLFTNLQQALDRSDMLSFDLIFPAESSKAVSL